MLTIAIVCALVADIVLVNRFSDACNVSLENDQVAEDLQTLGFSSVSYGDEAHTPTDGYTLVSVEVGEQRDEGNDGTDVLATITHAGDRRLVYADITLSNGYYQVVVPAYIDYRFAGGTWVITGIDEDAGMITPVAGLDVDTLGWSEIRQELAVFDADVLAYYTDPELTFEDEQDATGGMVKVHMEQKQSGTFIDHQANVLLETSYADGIWQVEVADVSDDYALTRYDALVGIWTGTWTSTETAPSSATACNAAQGTNPTLTVASYDPATGSFEATLSFEEHQHGQRRVRTSTTTEDVYTVDTDAWISNVTLTGESVGSTGTTITAYDDPFGTTSTRMMEVEGRLQADGTIALAVRQNFIYDQDGNAYTLSTSGTSSATVYTDHYTMTKTG